MALRFRPMPGLTLVVLICLPILLGLGLWQYQRWQWKTDVLSEIDTAVSAPPLQGMNELLALPDDTPVDFRRIQINGTATGPTWHAYRPEAGIQWQPFRVVEDGRQQALVGFPTFDDRVKDAAGPPNLTGPRAGYVRRIRPASGFGKWLAADHNPADNRWFAINPEGSWMSGSELYIDLDATETDASALPVRRPDIANNHVSYMLTWWSFAIILLIIYAILHRRAGRLSWS